MECAIENIFFSHIIFIKKKREEKAICKKRCIFTQDRLVLQLQVFPYLRN